MIKIAIVDDQEEYLTILNDQVRKLCFNKSFEYKINMFRSGNELLQVYAQNEHYDIIFLDIDMPGINGISISKELYLKGNNTIIVFITSHSELMSEAFGMNVYSFINKIDINIKLPYIFNKILNIFNQTKNIVFKTEVGYTKFSTSSIVAISVESRKLYLYLNNNEKIRIYDYFLSEIQKKINNNHFIYASRSLLINLRYVKGIVHDRICTTNDLSFEISKYKRKEIEGKFLEFLEEI